MPFVQADKARFESPRADNALLAYLIGVLALVSIFAFCMYRGMQPTVLANVGAAAFESNVGTVGFEKDRSVVVMLASRPTIDRIEKSEVAAALEENERQGLENVASRKPQVTKGIGAKTRQGASAGQAEASGACAPAWARSIRPTCLGLREESRSFGGFGSWYR